MNKGLDREFPVESQMMVKRMKAMIVSVGGTPAPVIFSLNKSKPEYICFFVSKETKRMMEGEIFRALIISHAITTGLLHQTLNSFQIAIHRSIKSYPKS